MIKTLLYTGVRVTELIHIKLSDIDLDRCQIRINEVNGKKDRIVPYPNGFREILAIHIDNAKKISNPTCLSPHIKNNTLTVV